MSDVKSNKHYRVVGGLLTLAVVAGIALSACSTTPAGATQASDVVPANNVTAVETGPAQASDGIPANSVTVVGIEPAQASDGSPARTLTVVGTGSASAVPDLATAQIGVETQAASPQPATRQNEKRLQAVIEALKAAGIAEADIQMAYYNLYAEPSFDPATNQPTGEFTYRVSNGLSVKVRDLTQVGAVLGAAVEAGANSIAGVSFSIADTTALEATAREQAVADAKARAQSLAALGGVELGEVVAISEVIGGPGPVFSEPGGLGGGGESFQPGELEVRMQVQVSFAIK
ncbi:MAG TPA: SIMPL domain-containing protein [Candidatus Binatia bacterium]|nr:SIMPL domain-containing protein [Candidatus Binatia bacterium]